MVRQVTLSRNEVNNLLNGLERIEATDGRPGFSKKETAEARDLLTRPIEEIYLRTLSPAQLNELFDDALEIESKEDRKRAMVMVRLIYRLSKSKQSNILAGLEEDKTVLFENRRSITARSLYKFLSQLRRANRNLPEDGKVCLPEKIFSYSPTFPRSKSETACHFITYSLRLAIRERKNNFKVNITQARESSPIDPYNPMELLDIPPKREFGKLDPELPFFSPFRPLPKDGAVWPTYPPRPAPSVIPDMPAVPMPIFPPQEEETHILPPGYPPLLPGFDNEEFWKLLLLSPRVRSALLIP